MGTSCLRDAKSLPYGWRCENQGGRGVMLQIYLVYQAFKNFSSKVRKVFAKAPFRVIMGENIFEAGIPYDYCH